MDLEVRVFGARKLGVIDGCECHNCRFKLSPNLKVGDGSAEARRKTGSQLRR